MKEHLTLFELTTQIKSVIQSGFENKYWVVGEISEIRQNANGHCYLELVQKDELNDRIVSRIRCTIWSYVFRMVKPYFESITRQTLSTGIRVLVRVTVEYHENYGLSLNIHDIDPSYTAGDLALKRQEVINQLKSEGIFDMNRDLNLPEVIQKVAVISSPTAAGYGDFMDQLEHNPYGFKFYTALFKAAMQGNEAEASIISALEKIYAYEDFFDVVVLIRGGGATADLNCFDQYWLASNIAQYPLPVFSGIGHERDETVADMVVNRKLKTPTAVAGFIIETNLDFFRHIENKTKMALSGSDNYLETLGRQIVSLSHKTEALSQKKLSKELFTLSERKHQLSQIKQRYFYFRAEHQKESLNKLANNLEKQFLRRALDLKFKAESDAARLQFINNINKDRLAKLTHRIFESNKQGFISKSESLERTKETLAYKIRNCLWKNANRLEITNEKIQNANPAEALKKGYTITFHNNKWVKDPSRLQPEDLLETLFANGKVSSRIIKNDDK